MAHPIWPLFDLVVRTPRLELRYVDDDLATALAGLAADGVHDPGWMPFSMPWTDVPSPQLERNSMQWFWRCRAELQPEAWQLPMAVVVDGEVAGVQDIIARNRFAVHRTFSTGSWLGRAHQGKGIGKEMRAAVLHLGFEGLGAGCAHTEAWEDNASSLGVTRSLGYEPNGERIDTRRGDVAATMLAFRMTRDAWLGRRRDDIVIENLGPCLPLLGLE
jgi:RimJ/RimL family protein N-acetyltransferase